MGTTSTDVTIVGCGPVGATLAILLRSRGFAVTIVERHLDIYHLPRALNMDAEIRRMFQNHAMEQHLAPLLEPLPGAEFVDAEFNHILGNEVPAGTLSSLGHPPSNCYYQPELDTLLRTIARERGANVRLGESLVSLTQNESRVTAILDSGATIESDWLIGADGANSTVRGLLDLDVEDLDFDQDWLVVDVQLHRDRQVELPHIAQQLCDPNRPSTFVPGVRLHRRWEFQIQEGETHDEMTRPEKVWELIAPWMSQDDGTITRAVIYRFHAMVADQMRVARVFLAGDSAHQMPPFLGQGCNTGMRDAANLAWKLEFVSRGLAGDELLDTYERERKPHAREMVAHAADVGRLIDSLAGRVEHDVDKSTGYGGSRRPSAYSEGVVVGDDELVGRQLRQPIVNGNYFDERLSRSFDVVSNDPSLVMPSDLARLGGRMVPAVSAEQIAGHGAVIVRPDRYIAATANTQSELDEAASALVAKFY